MLLKKRLTAETGADACVLTVVDTQKAPYKHEWNWTQARQVLIQAYGMATKGLESYK